MNIMNKIEDKQLSLVLMRGGAISILDKIFSYSSGGTPASPTYWIDINGTQILDINGDPIEVNAP